MKIKIQLPEKIEERISHLGSYSYLFLKDVITNITMEQNGGDVSWNLVKIEALKKIGSN